MSNRAAEIARIMMEEWPEGESAKSFVLRRFPKDTYRNLKAAVEIMAELEKADSIAEEWLDSKGDQ